jgi:hypothetical protein
MESSVSPPVFLEGGGGQKIEILKYHKKFQICLKRQEKCFNFFNIS